MRALRQGRRLAGAGDAETGRRLAGDRPDLVKLGQFAGQYGFVMNGGTSAKALSVYELQAKEFTGYWAGAEDLDDGARRRPPAGMAELLK